MLTKATAELQLEDIKLLAQNRGKREPVHRLQVGPRWHH